MPMNIRLGILLAAFTVLLGRSTDAYAAQGKGDPPPAQAKRVVEAFRSLGFSEPTHGISNQDYYAHAFAKSPLALRGPFIAAQFCRTNGVPGQMRYEWRFALDIVPRAGDPHWDDPSAELRWGGVGLEKYRAKEYKKRWESWGNLDDSRLRESMKLEVLDLGNGARAAVIAGPGMSPFLNPCDASGRFMCGGVAIWGSWRRQAPSPEWFAEYSKGVKDPIAKFKEESKGLGVIAMRAFFTQLHAALKEKDACECLSDTPPPGQLRVDLLDANPQFTDNFDLTDEREFKQLVEPKQYFERVSYVVTAAAVPRVGVVADGVSLLLLRAKVDGPCRATFSLEGDEAGDFHEIGRDFDLKQRESKVTVQAIKYERGEEKTWWAVALYRPPDAFGRRRGPRDVRLKLVTEADAGGARHTGARSIRLVRTPVVLVHGTFDAPMPCWGTPIPANPMTMLGRLAQETFHVSMVDWKETNGYKDPSDFETNRKTVWSNNGGIRDVLAALREQGFAATQADVVGHSQGGVIARRYVRGSMAPRTEDEDHYTDPRECSRGVCWYHRKDNWGQGDIRRLITLSTTHGGSDASRVLDTYTRLRKEGYEIEAWDEVCKSILSLGTHYQGAEGFAFPQELVVRLGKKGTMTGAYLDQVPESPALRAIGRTRVPSHAIACTCEDEDMMDLKAEYQERWEKLWVHSPREVLKAAFTMLDQPDDAEALVLLKDDYEKKKEEALAAALTGAEALIKRNDNARRVYARRLRAAAFGNCPNDSTVREESSLGGLPAKYTTIIPDVLHGYAPAYKSVQDRIVELLLSEDGKLFCREGFPPAGIRQTNRKYIPNSIRGLADGDPVLNAAPKQADASSEAAGKEAPQGGVDNMPQDERVSKANEKAMVLIKAKRYDEAEKMLRRELVDFPDEAYLWMTLANVHAFQERWPDAVAAARKVVEQLPDDGDALAELAGFLLQAGRREDAVREARKAQKLGVTGYSFFKDLGLE